MSNKYDTEFNAQQRHADYIRKAVDALQGAPVPTEGRSDLAASSDEPFSDFWEDAKVAGQPADAALRERVQDICDRVAAGLRPPTATNAIMQLFHEQQAQAVQAGRHAEFDMWFGRYLMQPPTGDFTVTITRQALIQRQKDFYYSSELQATQPPAADTTKQGEGE